MQAMAHPRGKAQSNEINAKRRLTGTLSLTKFCGAPSALANPNLPPGLKINAPAKAATDARADHSITADRHCDDTKIGESAQ